MLKEINSVRCISWAEWPNKMTIEMHLRSIWWYYAASMHRVYKHTIRRMSSHSNRIFTFTFPTNWLFFSLFLSFLLLLLHLQYLLILLVEIMECSFFRSHRAYAIDSESNILFKILEVGQQSTKALQLCTRTMLVYTYTHTQCVLSCSWPNVPALHKHIWSEQAQTYVQCSKQNIQQSGIWNSNINR